MLTINIQDQLPVGKVVHVLSFEVAVEKLTVRDLIRKRVHEEVSLFNLSKPVYFQGLIQPSDTEATLNGYKLSKRKEVDWEIQADLAIQAFQQNGFLIMIDNHQVDQLDEIIEIHENVHVTFIKLVPLVGG